MVIEGGIPLVTEDVRDSKDMCDVVTEINHFSNLLGYQQRLEEGWRLRSKGKAISAAMHYDPGAKAKLDVASESFEDVEFDVVARVVALEDAPIGDLSGVLDEALRSPERDLVGGDPPPDGDEVDPSGDNVKTVE
jgi:hypothetical protein